MSKDEKPIHYEPHPVSPERKAELIAKGVRIVDAIYAPADGGRVPEADERAVLIAELKTKGVQFDESWPTDELRGLTITPVDDAALTEAQERADLVSELKARGATFEEALPINELRVLHLTFKPAEPKSSGRGKAKPAEPKE